MKELILSAIIVVGTAFVYIWRRYGTRDAKKEKLREELADVVEKMEQMEKHPDAQDFDYEHYYQLHHRRMQLNEQIGLNR